jgi:Domain of unknown function (DUF4439)
VSPSARTAASQAAAQAAIRALQAALAAENSAVYGYGVAGAHLTGARKAAAVRDWVAHENARDTLTVMLAARGGQPVAAAAVYELPFPVRGASAAVSFAAYLEDRVTSVYLGLVALSDPALRAFGAAQVRTAALRAAGWRGSTVAFPGLDLPVPRAPGTAARASRSSPPGGAAAGPSKARAGGG